MQGDVFGLLVDDRHLVRRVLHLKLAKGRRVGFEAGHRERLKVFVADVLRARTPEHAQRVLATPAFDQGDGADRDVGLGEGDSPALLVFEDPRLFVITAERELAVLGRCVMGGKDIDQRAAALERFAAAHEAQQSAGSNRFPVGEH